MTRMTCEAGLLSSKIDFYMLERVCEDGLQNIMRKHRDASMPWLAESNRSAQKCSKQTTFLFDIDVH